MTMPLTAIWRTFTSSYLALVLIPIVTFTAYSNAQTFDPVVEDKVYLNKLEKEIQDEVNTTRVNFYKQAHLLDNVARQFVAAQLKENLFIALRVLAERELANLRGNSSDTDEATASEPGLPPVTLDFDLSSTTADPEVDTATLSEVSTSTVTSVPTTTTLRSHVRRKRQDDGDDDGDDGGDAAAAAAAGVPNRPTIPPQIGLLPQVANLVRVIFGGNGQVNFTSYVASATKLLPRPVGNQVLGLVKILNNANQNNRNSFTTANPLNTGQLPANLDLKSPAVAGLTPEQLLALGLPSNAALEGLTPEQLNSLAGLAAAAGTPGAGAAGALGGAGAVGGPGAAAAGLPAGLTPQDIAYLAALGIPDLPNLGATPPSPPPRSTRKPRPNYAPHNKNKQPPQQQQPQQQQQQLQSEQQLHNQQQLHLQQQQLQAPPSFHQPAHEQAFISPTYSPNYGNSPPNPNYGHNPQFASAEKDILPLNLNPNKQTLSEIQQHVNAQHAQIPKYQETPQSAAQPTLFGPSSSNNYLPGNNFSPVGGNTQQHNAPSPISQPQSNYYQPQSNLGGAHSGQQESQSNFIPVGKPEREVHSTSGIASNQAVKPQKAPSPSGGKTRRPRPPSAFAQQQAQLQAQQLQQLQLLQQQESHGSQERPQPQLQEEHQPIQAQRPQKTPVQQHQQHFQQPSQSQFIQQQQPQPSFNQQQPSQPPFNQQQQSKPTFHQQQEPQPSFNQQPQNPSFQQRPQYQQQPQSQFQQPQPPIQQGSRPQPPFQGRPQSQFQQQLTPNQLQQKYQQQLFQQRPPPQIDEDESEEADTDYNDPFDRKARQLNLFQNLLPVFLRPNNNNNNNNNRNNNNNNNNNSNNGQQQQPSQNNNTTSSSNNNNNNNNNQGNNTSNGGNNNSNNNNNQNNGFDLNMFAQSLSRGMGDVIRVMPDLFRGAREGLQLIQALSSILRAFPGLADALPILS